MNADIRGRVAAAAKLELVDPRRSVYATLAERVVAVIHRRSGRAALSRLATRTGFG